MDIHEALVARTKQRPFLTRRAWKKILLMDGNSSVYIQPTDTPECCLVYGPSQKGPRRGWQPTETDLLATDWETTTGD